MENARPVRLVGLLCIISKLGKRAGVVQWQYRSFPSFGRGFDSHRPLQILKHLRSRAGFHGFQNINFVAKLHGKFGANVVERNLSSVPVCHSRRRMSHLLTNNSWFNTCKFDHPGALGFYQHLGFSVYRTDVPDGFPDPRLNPHLCGGAYPLTCAPHVPLARQSAQSE